MKAFEYVHAPDLGEALRLSSVRGARVKAGGLDLLDRMKEGTIEVSRLVNLDRIPGLREIAADEKGISIGPMATLAALSEADALRKRCAAVAEAAGEAATPQVRNRATAAGNLLQRPRCPYFRNEDFHCMKKGGDVCFAEEGDHRHHAILSHGPSHIVHPSNLAVALMVFEARLTLLSEEGEREVALRDFWVLPEDDLSRENRLGESELIARITIPAGAGALWRSAYREVRERQAYDWPLVSAAVALKVRDGVCEEARICLGAVAPIPCLAEKAAQTLVGRKPDEAAAREAAEAAFEGATPLPGNAYKVPIGKALLRRTILECGRHHG